MRLRDAAWRGLCNAFRDIRPFLVVAGWMYAVGILAAIVLIALGYTPNTN
jgi:hypothetical protein